jgi:hypothetical protein
MFMEAEKSWGAERGFCRKSAAMVGILGLTTVNEVHPCPAVMQSATSH